MSITSPIRIGAVSYLNTKPLVHELSHLAPDALLTFDVPSRLADQLAADELDVALIPTVEFFQDSDYRIVSDACIGCRGPVLSVKLFSRVPPPKIRSLALDCGSRTSAALVQILLAERYGIQPRLAPLDFDAEFADAGEDAVLLIGDRAIHSPIGEFAEVWDLGDEWCAWAELPFVFAMWTARRGKDLRGVESALVAARDTGVSRLEAIARDQAAGLGLTVPECYSYLRDNLHFRLGERELAGLERFHTLCVERGLAPPGVELDICNLNTAR